MKKLIAAIFAAVLMSAGLVYAAGTTAVAAPYPGTVDTSVNVNGPSGVSQGRKAVIKTRVTTSGNGTPKGTITIVVKRDAGGYYFSDSAKYDGGAEVFATSKLTKKGKYSVTVKFTAKDGSVFKDSKGFDSFRVS